MKPAPASSTSVSDDFDDDQRARSSAARACRRCRSAAAFLQHLVDVGLRDVQRRRQAEHDRRCRDRSAPKNANTDGVHRELDPVRLADVGRDARRTAGRRRSPRPSPSRPLTVDSSRLSTSSWRTMRQRLAPSDTRTASRASGAAERASSRLATLAHAISSTNATAPISDRKISLICGPVDAFVERHHAGRDVLVRVGIVVRQLRGDGVELRLRLRQRDAGRQPAERLEVARRRASGRATRAAAATAGARGRC